MSLKLYFIRHGETVYSQKGGYCGSLDPELTSVGIKMAEQFAAAYHSIPWVAAYVSPMQPTIATAKPLCTAVGLEMQLRDGLKEIAYGKWEGQLPETVNRDFHDDYVRWLTDPGWNAPTGGERGVDIARRSVRAAWRSHSSDSRDLRELSDRECFGSLPQGNYKNNAM